MRAGEELAKRQRESPLGSDSDRVRELFNTLPALKDEQYEAVRVSPMLAVGEINRRQPNAKTFHFPDGSHLITIFSGLLEFYSIACDLLMRAATFHTEKGESAGVSMEDVQEDLKQLFLMWTPQGIEQTRPAKLAMSSFANEHRNADARQLLEGALRFVLCHELGHVLFYAPSESATKSEGLTREQELRSDEAGLRASTECTPGIGAMRMNFAGCVISLRILSVFGLTGHTFSGDHPDPLSRLENVFSLFRKLCVDPGLYWWSTPIAYAFDEQLESVGQALVGGPDVLPVRADRTFSRLCSVLEEVMLRRQEESIVVPLMQREFEEATDEQMEVIARFAAEMFSPWASARGSLGQNWSAKAKIFGRVYRQWPERAVGAFNRAMMTYKGAGRRIDGDNWMS